jgi:hypothetical protein
MNIADTAHGASSVLRRSSLTRAGIGLAALVLAGGVLFIAPATAARAQDPGYNGRMEDVNPGSGAPGTDVIVVEGLGTSTSCLPDVSEVEEATVAFLNSGHRTITEISPQSYCNTLSNYESYKIAGIASYVEANSPYAVTLWGGFMLDEEPGFDFSASQLESLNSYTANVMSGTPGISWYYTENQPNGWALSTYNAILGSSYPAPQVYSTSMADSVNSECGTYDVCINLVTYDGDAGSPWDNPVYVTGLVDGPCFYEWSIYLANLWVAT